MNRRPLSSRAPESSPITRRSVSKLPVAASLALVQATRARALSSGRPFVIPDDIKALAIPVLAHRLVLTPEAEMEGVARESIVQNALEQVPHRWEATR